MADIDFNLIGQLEEKVETLTFRNKASFKIGKTKREIAYTMAIDIVVESVDYNLYENSKANPSIQFYGYCVLVFQDMTSIEIPIHFPRQRLYYAIQREAFRQWRGFVNYYEGYLLHQQTSITLGLLLAAFDIPPFQLDSQLAKTQWIELPLREVYIKCQKNTQFKVEYTAWNPVAFSDPLTGQPNDGKSNQEDGEKDNGLPKDGIQPKRNEPSSPFSGNSPASSFEEIGLKGFESIDDSSLGLADPHNTPPSLFWIELRKPRTAASFNPSCSTKYSVVIIPLSQANEPYTLSFQSMGIDSCGNNSYGVYTVTSQITGQVLGTAGYLEAFGGGIQYKSGNVYPPTIYYSNTEV